MSKISVICKQQKPARILIKAAYWEQLQRLQFRRKQVENRFLPPVLGGAEDAGRLIKHEIAKLHIARSLLSAAVPCARPRQAPTGTYPIASEA